MNHPLVVFVYLFLNIDKFGIRPSLTMSVKCSTAFLWSSEYLSRFDYTNGVIICRRWLYVHLNWTFEVHTKISLFSARLISHELICSIKMILFLLEFKFCFESPFGSFCLFVPKHRQIWHKSFIDHVCEMLHSFSMKQWISIKIWLY